MWHCEFWQLNNILLGESSKNEKKIREMEQLLVTKALVFPRFSRPSIRPEKCQRTCEWRCRRCGPLHPGELTQSADVSHAKLSSSLCRLWNPQPELRSAFFNPCRKHTWMPQTDNISTSQWMVFISEGWFYFTFHQQLNTINPSANHCFCPKRKSSL